MEIKERYLWVVFFVAVAAVSIYFGLYNKQPMSLSISMPSFSSLTIYPYQSVSIPILINNTGQTAINNLPIGLYVNGNITQNYKATIPVGTHATINYTLYPTSSGTYTVSLIADPSKLYLFSDRSQTQKSTSVTVSPQERAEPYINFADGAVSQDLFNLSITGFASTLFFDNFTNRFYLTGSQSLNGLLYPLLKVYAQYINHIALSHAYYSNYSLSSLWLEGPLTQNAIDVAATGKGYNVSHVALGPSLNVSLIDFGSNTTLCSWYSGGWTKIFMSVFGKSCTSFLNNSAAPLNYSDLYFMLKNRNSSILNYSGFNGNLVFAGDIALTGNALVYEGLMKGVNFSNLCSGNILNLSGNSYCYGSLWAGNTSTLTQMNQLNGPYNLSIWAISGVNDSATVQLYALNLSKSYGNLGPEHLYISTFVDVCSFNLNLPCSDPRFNATTNTSSLQIQITNPYNDTVTLHGMSCSSFGEAPETKFNVNLAAGKNTTISAPCYNNGKLIAGVTPVYIVFSLKLNYTHGATTNVTQGYVEITK